MSFEPINISLVVATLGRTAELYTLFNSLSSQHRTDFEVLIVDQNPDDRLAQLTNQSWPFPVIRLHVPSIRGLSRARNIGWKAAQGKLVIFPDDDCWYPSCFLTHGIELMTALQADILTGRAADEAGNDINGRYAQEGHAIDRANVWISGIEWVMLFTKRALRAVDGFDENVGVGASSPWQACEGQDILLRALSKGLICLFDPSFFGHHALFDAISTEAQCAKGRAYGRGLGHVLRKHRYGRVDAASWICRPLARLLICAARRDFHKCLYFYNVSVGRFEGYFRPAPAIPYGPRVVSYDAGNADDAIQ
jgi:cellulose synthase/poly-beta-1,6-N-acetylglucosamine synthase-like glycosyltransferase